VVRRIWLKSRLGLCCSAQTACGRCKMGSERSADLIYNAACKAGASGPVDNATSPSQRPVRELLPLVRKPVSTWSSRFLRSPAEIDAVDPRGMGNAFILRVSATMAFFRPPRLTSRMAHDLKADGRATRVIRMISSAASTTQILVGGVPLWLV